MEDDYDVVIATLREKRDILWNLTRSNMNCEFYTELGIMDQIRLKQIVQLDEAIKLWENGK